MSKSKRKSKGRPNEPRFNQPNGGDAPGVDDGPRGPVPPALPQGQSELGRWLPWVIAGLAVVYLVYSMVPKTIDHPMAMRDFAHIPASADGRVQPLDSFARNTLLIINERSDFRPDLLRLHQIDDMTGLAKAVVAGKDQPGTPAHRLWQIWLPAHRQTIQNAATVTTLDDATKLNVLEAFNFAIDDDLRRELRELGQRMVDDNIDFSRIIPDRAPNHHARLFLEDALKRGEAVLDDDRFGRFYDPQVFADYDLSPAQRGLFEKMQAWDSRDPAADVSPGDKPGIPLVIDLNRQALHAAFSDYLSAAKADKERAIFWLADTAADTRASRVHRVFRIVHPQVLEFLGLESRDGFRYAFAEFDNRLELIERESESARAVDSKERDAYQQGIVDLSGQLGQFMAVSRHFRPFWVPPQGGGDWTQLARAAPNETLAEVEILRNMFAAYRANDPKEFNNRVAAYLDRMDTALPEEANRTSFEVFFNEFDVFTPVSHLYIQVFLLAALSWLLSSTTWREPLRRSAFYLMIVLVVAHTFGLVSRMYLMDRPFVFVTNLYASAIFIGWGALIACIFLERITKLGVASAVAAVIGGVTGIIATHLRADGDTLEMQQAVLDTNFWLATHVTTVTLGYAATYLAGALAVAFILGGVFFKGLDKSVRKTISGMIYGVICFALLFSFVGTVLGGIWADQSWGRFWGWDPKENGALMIVIWNALILHARWGGLVQARGIANLAIFGNIVTTWSWFGTNQLGVGLHAYGFMETAVFWILVFIASQLVIIGIGAMPTKYWQSLRERADDRASYIPPLATAAGLTALFATLIGMMMY